MLARISRLSMSRRGFATAATKTAVADELRFTFATPNQQADVPTLAGVVGILANHVPTIGVLKPGVVHVTEVDGNVAKFFVSSGTLSMNIDGSCQVLAEEVAKLDEIDESAARAELESAQRASTEGSDLAKAEAQIRAEVAEALLKAVSV